MTNVINLKSEPSLSFEDFWKAFPKRVGKLLAKAKWDAITNGGLKTRIFDRDSRTYLEINLVATAEEIIAGAKRYRASQIDGSKCGVDWDRLVLKDDGKYTCHPSSWLNQGRWLDD